jgi:hypothetical protein
MSPRPAHLLDFVPSALLLLVGGFLVALSLLSAGASRADEPVVFAEPASAYVTDVELRHSRDR